MMQVPVKWLEQVVDPLNNPPWPNVHLGITVPEICEQAGNFIPRPRQYDPFKHGKTETRLDHINRIAYYYKSGWGESHILLILKEDPSWVPLLDGFHRTCAAIARRDDMIAAEVLGPISEIRKIYEFEERLLKAS